MIKVGLTGNIGSGKSTVCKIFETLGVPVFYSDVQAKKLYQRQVVKEELFKQFGDSVFNHLKEVDFKKLAAVIFSDRELLNFINRLIHPLVFKSYHKWLDEHQQYSYTLHESAILFEHHLEKRFDKTIVVYCPQTIRIQRVVKRDGISENEVLKRISNQMNDQLKNSLADFVIVNNDTNMILPQIMEIDQQLT
ncbi:MAG: dephospho-CoA kinase [Bacteroidetes bacterium]|nr:MAG: dephospho-CoA kinase [Bacteroidota bacterium]